MIETLIMGCDNPHFNAVKVRGFLPNEVENLICRWSKVSSEYKLQVIAEAIFAHYKAFPEYGPFLSKTLTSLQISAKHSASYRLGKILKVWLHDRWPTLPTTNLTPEQAYNLFPEHALPPPVIPFDEKPFETFSHNWNSIPQKMLHRPTGWKGALDAISKVIDHIEPPKMVTVIGFGDGQELNLLHKKWPEAKILGFELPFVQSGHHKLTFLSEDTTDKLSVEYDENPDSYKYCGNPVDLILVRHPDPLSHNCWSKIVFKALEALTPDGLLLLTFHSKVEMLSLKMAFYEEGLHGFLWKDCVNPMAYNPLFTSTKGTYTFDFYLVTITRSRKIDLPLFENLQRHFTSARKKEIPTFQSYSPIRKYSVIKLQRSLIVSKPDSEGVNKQQGDKPQKCLICDKEGMRFFRTCAELVGVSSSVGVATVSVSTFCAGHLPNDAGELESILKRTGSNSGVRVNRYQVVGQSFPNPMLTSKL